MSGLVDMWTYEVRNKKGKDEAEVPIETRKESSELIRQNYEKCVSLLAEVVVSKSPFSGMKITVHNHPLHLLAGDVPRVVQIGIQLKELTSDQEERPEIVAVEAPVSTDCVSETVECSHTSPPTI
ncbi:hypothetical protein H5410_052271 [Solanum commersonii]|uniref:Uncharacterized protein n=1 Tax=Solanum commersonii TaxID=4109 RepID=A0A9J5X2X0_SOLCO|nr:hypothetical protein H5410_052271 [Solanum commersonii]